MVLRTGTTYVLVPLVMPASTTLTLSQIKFQVTGVNSVGVTWTAADVWDATNKIAKILVGPTAGTLPWPSGEYAHVFIRVTSSPEQPDMYAGKLLLEDTV